MVFKGLCFLIGFRIWKPDSVEKNINSRLSRGFKGVLGFCLLGECFAKAERHLKGALKKYSLPPPKKYNQNTANRQEKSKR